MDKSKADLKRLALGLALGAAEAAQQLDLLAIDLVDGGKPRGERRAEFGEALGDLDARRSPSAPSPG